MLSSNLKRVARVEFDVVELKGLGLAITTVATVHVDKDIITNSFKEKAMAVTSENDCTNTREMVLPFDERREIEEANLYYITCK